ncbi:MAG: HNH endonuclease [Haliscomenobacteraceae bacterium CHB4]|nr:HNH endonuclease [Haliscomenobacteraceae bacterium CHB4]
MNIVTTKEEILENLQTLENYLCEGTEEERTFAVSLIKKGACFITYQVNGEIRFSPSRFSGYQFNNLKKHLQSGIKDGRETNPTITKILNTKLLPNEDLERQHSEFCQSFGVSADNKKKKFWSLDSNEALIIKDEKQAASFPEGAIVERIHLHRERNSRVVNIAKENFKRTHGRLICQVCNFDFEAVYGEHGRDYIEGHHTIAVSEMLPDHKTKPEEIAMVCSNCHKMLHRTRPWLSIDRLKEILK